MPEFEFQFGYKLAKSRLKGSTLVPPGHGKIPQWQLSSFPFLLSGTDSTLLFCSNGSVTEKVDKAEYEQKHLLAFSLDLNDVFKMKPRNEILSGVCNLVEPVALVRSMNVLKSIAHFMSVNIHIVEVTQLRLTLHNPINHTPPSSSVHGILQARILEWEAISFSKGSSWPQDWTWVSCTVGRFCLSYLGSPMSFLWERVYIFHQLLK